MKNFSLFVLAGLMIGNLANAISIPGWERPIMGSRLTYIEGQAPVAGLRANYLTMNQQDESDKPTSFTLNEDTGIRCFTTPCPSSKGTLFIITSSSVAHHSHGNTVTYEAIEKLTNIPPHVRIAARRLFVTESDMELVAPGGHGFIHQTRWSVHVKSHPNQSQYYFGKPEPLASIAGE